jgi:hypothetical protein
MINTQVGFNISRHFKSYICSCILLLCVLSGCKKEETEDSQDEINFSFHEQNFGASAGDLLRSDQYTSLKVEIQYMTGFEPDAKAINNLRYFLLRYLHKPQGIFFIQKEIKPVEDTILTRDQVDNIRRSNRTIYTKDRQIALYILYTNGTFQNQDVLGQAFRNTCVVIYGKSIKKYESVWSFPTQTTIETTLLLHEMGHILGLVNKGSAMQTPHSDSTYEAHCNNPNCIMYWNMSIKPQFGPQKNKRSPFFDSACLSDLKRNGSR